MIRRTMRCLLPCLLLAAFATSSRSQTSAASAAHERVAAALDAAAREYEQSRRDEFRTELTHAHTALQEAQTALGIDKALRQHIPVISPRGSSTELPETLRQAAGQFREAARLLREGSSRAAENAASKAWENAEKAVNQDAFITDPLSVMSVLLVFLASLFALHQVPAARKLFHVIPLLVFAYFVPTVLSNLGLIPIQSSLYTFITRTLLPASLMLLVLSVDIPAILRLGRNAVILFLTATATIVLGGPLALFLCQGLIPDALGDQAWRGLAALSGSWIGGGANFVAIGESVGASANTLSMMVVVDVAVAEVWMIVLLFFAGREKQMDERIGADRRSLDEVRRRIAEFENEVSRPTTLPDLLTLLALAFGGTAVATALSGVLPPVGEIISSFTWVVLIVTALAVTLSFTPVRRLEGAGASKLGSVLLYVLVASIGARAQFSKVLEVPGLIVVGAVWMTFHATTLLLVRRWLKAPIFFAAVGSKANVGGAASAPILASAFHPALAPVGVLLAVGGYVLGSSAALLCAALLEWVS